MTEKSLFEDDDTLPDPPWMLSASTPLGLAATPATITAWGASSSAGLMRQDNEDRYGQQEATFAVADGMGGLNGGAEASESAIEAAFRRGSTLGAGAPLAEWKSVIRLVNKDVRTKMKGLGFTKAGTTLTMVAVEPDRVVVAHVGDSRLYELQKGLLRQRTVDHNLRNELAAIGKDLECAAARGLPLAGLTSYIGQPDEDLRVDVLAWSPGRGTRLLLCSDGIHSYVPKEAIAEVVAGYPPAEAAERLTQQAEAAGGRDNATTIVVEL